MAAGLLDGTVQEWDVATGKEVRAWQLAGKRPANGPTPHFETIQLAPDGQRLATVEWVFGQVDPNTRLSIWDAVTGKPIRQRSFSGLRRRFSWSADGDTLTVAVDTGVVLIDLHTGEDRGWLDGSAPESPVVAMGPEAISVDSRLVAAMCGDPMTGPKPVGIYEVVTGKPVTTVGAHWVFAIGRDNRTLFTVDDTHIRAWDLATGKELARRAIPEGSKKTYRVPTETTLVPLAGRRVFTAMADGTGLVWDFSPIAVTGVTADEKQLAAWWADLRSDDPARAYAAVWGMSEVAPDRVVAFLSRHLRPEAAPDSAKVAQLIADLDSDTFRVRERAAKELEALGHAAAPALQKALAAGPSAETARRIEQLLARKLASASRPDELRRLRAMQVLERANTAEARKILSDFAGGLPLAPETKEAKAALARTSP